MTFGRTQLEFCRWGQIYQIYCSTDPPMPNDTSRCCKRMSWSTVSNAALWSGRPRRVTLWSSAALNIYDITLFSAISVEWCWWYEDSSGGMRWQFWDVYGSSQQRYVQWDGVVISQFILVSAMYCFRTGVLMAAFCDAGRLLCWIDMPHIVQMNIKRTYIISRWTVVGNRY